MIKPLKIKCFIFYSPKRSLILLFISILVPSFGDCSTTLVPVPEYSTSTGYNSLDASFAVFPITFGTVK